MSVTIKDIARIAGTSTATVSKAMNGSSTISEATTKKILRIAKEMKYHPNARAQSFAKQKNQTIFFLAKLQKDTAFQTPHIYEILSGAQQALHEKGYRLCLQHVDEKHAGQEIAQLIEQKCADGVILHASIVTKKLAEQIGKQSFAHIVIGQPNFESGLCWLDTNNILSGELAVRHLTDIGKRTIGFIGGKPDDMISWHRLRGMRNALEECGIEPINAYIKQGDSTIQEGFRMTCQLLKNKQRPQAIICANNLVALGCIQALEEKKIKIPEEIALVTFDDYPFSRISEPALTVVNIDVFDLGRQAGRWIVEKIRKPNLQLQAYATLPELIVRESTIKPL